MAFTIDGTNGLTFNNSTVQASAGQVLQVVNATYATLVSTSSNVFADTNLTATITPKFNTSKILVLVSQNGVAKSTNDTFARFQVLRNSTSIITFERQLNYTASSGTTSSSVSTNYLDSPATTSATTYKTQVSSGANNAVIEVQASSSTSTITLMEIAG
jgi:hypothetical protein